MLARERDGSGGDRVCADRHASHRGWQVVAKQAQHSSTNLVCANGMKRQFAAIQVKSRLFPARQSEIAELQSVFFDQVNKLLLAVGRHLASPVLALSK